MRVRVTRVEPIITRGNFMARPTTFQGVRRAIALGSVASVSALGLVAVGAPAHAATGPVVYACETSDGPMDLNVELDAEFSQVWWLDPNRTQLKTMVPDEWVQEAADAGAVDAQTSLRLQVTDLAGVKTVDMSAITPLGDQSTPTAVPVQAAGLHSMDAIGTNRLTAGALTARVTFREADGSTAFGPIDLSCQPPAGPPPLIDTIDVVGRTATTLTVDKTTAQHGEPVMATAQVQTLGDPRNVDPNPRGPFPAGNVEFVVDGVSRIAKVDTFGRASLTLHDLPLAVSTINATFQPADPVHYTASSARPSLVTVSKAATASHVSVTGKRSPTRIQVTVRVRGEFGTIPTGKVRIKLRRIGTTQRWLRSGKSLNDGDRTVAFRRLPAGRYRYKITYFGDDLHVGSRTTRTFRIRKS